MSPADFVQFTMKFGSLPNVESESSKPMRSTERKMKKVPNGAVRKTAKSAAKIDSEEALGEISDSQDERLDAVDALVDELEACARLSLEQGDADGALQNVKKAIEQLDGRQGRLGKLGKLHALLGAVYDKTGNPQGTVSAWTTAVDLFEKNDPPLLMCVAGISNNLGYMAKRSGDFNAAEDHFLKAVKIMIAELGEKNEKTALVCNNLGELYLATGYPDQAREAHMMALEARYEIFGESHPDTAQSHNNLALALLKLGERIPAKRHFEKSLTGFGSLGQEYAYDFEAVVSNYREFLEEDDSDLSEEMSTRVRALLGKG
ncbi:MAG: tetratricopeptide repeat protein [Luteolibacter sp.]